MTWFKVRVRLGLGLGVCKIERESDRERGSEGGRWTIALSVSVSY